jgi:hypothetical protein
VLNQVIESSKSIKNMTHPEFNVRGVSCFKDEGVAKKKTCCYSRHLDWQVWAKLLAYATLI